MYTRLIKRASERAPRTLLELGSGGGNNASHLKRHFRLTLTDIAPQMLAVSRTINPQSEHIPGDMRTLRLRREFDAVFVHDAIDYITNARDLRRALRTAFVHCRAGGVALFAPDFFRETFRSSTRHGGHDGNGKGLRYLEWTHKPDRGGATYEVEYAYVLREKGRSTVEVDRHVCGLFSRAEWLAAVRGAGFEVVSVTHPAGCSCAIVARKPRRASRRARGRTRAARSK